MEQNQAMFSIIRNEALDEAAEQVDNDNFDNNNEEVEQYAANQNSPAQNIDVINQGGGHKDTKAKTTINKSRYTCPAKVKENELHCMIIQLNPTPKEFVMHMLNCYKLNKLPFQIFLSGSAGVGKSKVISTLYELITNYYDNLPDGNMDDIIVLLTAPSGEAAYLINGVTLHTTFALPTKRYGVNLPKLSNDIANNIREKLSKCKLLIIDEISMVSCTIFGRIDTRLRQIMGVNQAFGGVSVLVVDDLIYKLTEVMRQKDDLPLINALNNSALRKMTEDDIKLIKSREITNEKNILETAIRLYATNANVLAYNALKIRQCNSPA